MKAEYSSYTDIELYAMMRQEKPISDKAFAELYSRFSSRVYAYCRRIVGNRDEAQDVFQEAFMRFYRSAQIEREMTNVPAFLLRIARNLCLNSKRDKRRIHVEFEDYHSFSRAGDTESGELLDLIKSALELLPDDYREAFVLREYDQLSYEEIAEVMGCGLSNAKIRVFRAKQKIRDVLAPYLADIQRM